MADKTARAERASTVFELNLWTLDRGQLLICDWMRLGIINTSWLRDDADLDHMQSLLRWLVNNDDKALHLCFHHEWQIHKARIALYPYVDPYHCGASPTWFQATYGDRSDTIKELLG